METLHTIDPVRLEIYRHLFTALTEEMGAALRRAAHSPNITERRDYSCAPFDAAGRRAAPSAHTPADLGAMPQRVSVPLAPCAPLEPGAELAPHDPFAGSRHLPDITLVTARRHEGAPIPHLATHAQRADVGGMAAA